MAETLSGIGEQGSSYKTYARYKRGSPSIVLLRPFYLVFSSIAVTWLLVLNLGLIIIILPLPSDCHQVAQTKRFLEPCEVTLSHCSSDDEDYETQDECELAQVDNCDKSLELYCIDGICQANCHPTAETYDDIQGKCFRKIGQTCKSSLNCDTTKNHECNRTARKCLCSKNYSLDFESGRCVLSSEFGEYCDPEIACDKLSDITCQSNRCDCASPESQFYHVGRRRCYIYVGYNCSGGLLRFCPDNSACLREFSKEDMLPGGIEPEDEPHLGILDDDSKVFKCKCNSGYGQTLDGKTCLGLHGTSCNSMYRCNTERSLKCYNGTCQCARPLLQRYDSLRQKCVNLVGMGCKAGNNGDPGVVPGDQGNGCVDWAQCIKDESTGISKCECVSGFMSSPDGICLKGHGQSCEVDYSFHENDEPICNIFVGLECSNVTETCQCKDPEQFYDVKMEVCRNFQVVPKSIPAIHFDFSDREYNFHQKSSTESSSHSNSQFLSILVVSFFVKLCLTFSI